MKSVATVLLVVLMFVMPLNHVSADEAVNRRGLTIINDNRIYVSENSTHLFYSHRFRDARRAFGLFTEYHVMAMDKQTGEHRAIFRTMEEICDMALVNDRIYVFTTPAFDWRNLYEIDLESGTSRRMLSHMSGVKKVLGAKGSRVYVTWSRDSYNKLGYYDREDGMLYAITTDCIYSESSDSCDVFWYGDESDGCWYEYDIASDTRRIVDVPSDMRIDSATGQYLILRSDDGEYAIFDRNNDELHYLDLSGYGKWLDFAAENNVLYFIADCYDQKNSIDAFRRILYRISPDDGYSINEVDDFYSYIGSAFCVADGRFIAEVYDEDVRAELGCIENRFYLFESPIGEFSWSIMAGAKS